jgi:hypothetical protein
MRDTFRYTRYYFDNYEKEISDKISTKSDAGDYHYNNNNHHITDLVAAEGYTPPNHILTYTAEGKVDTIKDTTYRKKVTFTYGTDNERFKNEYVKNDTVQYTRYSIRTKKKSLPTVPNGI